MMANLVEYHCLGIVLISGQKSSVIPAKSKRCDEPKDFRDQMRLAGSAAGKKTSGGKVFVV
jgi:hypothetical protein